MTFSYFYVIILAICFGTVYLLSGKVYEEGGYKGTGLKTEDGYKLQYNEDTGLVYIVEFKHRAGCVRIPYITDYGVTYSFNADTQELYIDLNKIEQELEKLKEVK